MSNQNMNREGFGSVSRRKLLQLGLGAAAVAGLGACSSGQSGQGGTTNSGPLTLPAHVDPPSFPGAIISKTAGVPPGYKSFPDSLIETVKGVPGNGEKITFFSLSSFGSLPAYSKNKFWQGLNKRLGVEWAATVVPTDSYSAKIATQLAGGSLLDLTVIYPSATTNKAIKQGAFANLADVLGGDEIKKWPNIAMLREDQWAGSVINNGLYGIPVDALAVNEMPRYRQDYATKAGICRITQER